MHAHPNTLFSVAYNNTIYSTLTKQKQTHFLNFNMKQPPTYNNKIKELTFILNNSASTPKACQNVKVKTT